MMLLAAHRRDRHSHLGIKPEQDPALPQGSDGVFFQPERSGNRQRLLPARLLACDPPDDESLRGFRYRQSAKHTIHLITLITTSASFYVVTPIVGPQLFDSQVS